MKRNLGSKSWLLCVVLALSLFAFASGGCGGSSGEKETSTASLFAGNWTAVSGTHYDTNGGETSVSNGELTIYATSQDSSSLSARLVGKVTFASGANLAWNNTEPRGHTKVSGTKIQATTPFTWNLSSGSIQFNVVRVIELTDDNTLVYSQQGSYYQNGAATFTINDKITFVRNQ